MIILRPGGFVTLVYGEIVCAFRAIAKLSKFLDWTYVMIAPLYNFFLSFFTSLFFLFRNV